MARIEVDGIDQLMAGLNQQGSRLRSIIDEALRMSAEHLKGELLAEEKKFKHPTGELGGTLTDHSYHAASASIVEVYNEGNYFGARGGGESRGGHAPRRAGFVAAMQENRNGNPFNRRAMNRSKKRINSIIVEQMRMSEG